jgi:hypothetical protein
VSYGIDDFSLGDRVRFRHATAYAEGEVVSVNRGVATVDVDLRDVGSARPRRLIKRPWELEKLSEASNAEGSAHRP